MVLSWSLTGRLGNIVGVRTLSALRHLEEPMKRLYTRQSYNVQRSCEGFTKIGNLFLGKSQHSNDRVLYSARWSSIRLLRDQLEVLAISQG